MLLLIEQFNQPPLYFLAIPNPPASRYLLHNSIKGPDTFIRFSHDTLNKCIRPLFWSRSLAFKHQFHFQVGTDCAGGILQGI
jgi:hypothetical protein